MTKSELKAEMKLRKLKVKVQTEEDIKRLLRREDKTQGRLCWGGQGARKASQHHMFEGGGGQSVKEEKGVRRPESC